MFDKLEKTYREIVETSEESISKESKYRDIVRNWHSGKIKDSLNDILANTANKDGAGDVSVLHFEGTPTFYFIKQPDADTYTLGIDPHKGELVVMSLTQMRELNTARKEEKEATSLPEEDEEFIQNESPDTTMTESFVDMLQRFRRLFEADLGFGNQMTDKAPESENLGMGAADKPKTGRYNHLASFAGQYDKFFGTNEFNKEGTKTDFLTQLLFFQAYAQLYKKRNGQVSQTQAAKPQPTTRDINPIGEAADPNWRAPEGYVPPKPTTGAEAALTTYLLYVPFANEFSKGKSSQMSDPELEQQYDFSLKSFNQSGIAKQTMDTFTQAVEPIYDEIQRKDPALGLNIKYYGDLLLSGAFDVRKSGNSYAQCSKLFQKAKETVDIGLFDGINQAMGIVNNFFSRIIGVRSRARATGPQTMTGNERKNVLPGQPDVSTAAKVTPVAPDELANILRAYFTTKGKDVKNSDYKDIAKSYEDSKNSVLKDYKTVAFAHTDFAKTFPAAYDLGKTFGDFIRKQQDIFYAFFDASKTEGDPVLEELHNDMRIRMLNNHQETYIDKWLKPYIPTLQHTLEGIIPFGFFDDDNKDFLEDFTAALKALLVTVHRTQIEIDNIEDSLENMGIEGGVDSTPDEADAVRDAWTKRLGILKGVQEGLFGKILALAYESLTIVSASGSKYAEKAREILRNGLDDATDLNRASVRNVIAAIITEALTIKVNANQNLASSIEGIVRGYVPDRVFNAYQRDNSERIKKGETPYISSSVAKTILTKILDDSTFHANARANSGIDKLPSAVVKDVSGDTASKYIERIAQVAPEGAIHDILLAISDSSEYASEAYGILEDFNALRDPQKGNVSFLPGKVDDALGKLQELVALYIKVGKEIMNGSDAGSRYIQQAVENDLPALLNRLDDVINTPQEGRKNAAGKTNTTYSTNRQNAIRAVFGK